MDRLKPLLRFFLLLHLLVICFLGQIFAQTLSNYDRDVARTMLHKIREDIKKNYYDPNFHEVDITERFKEAEDKINQATSNGQLFGIIAKAMLSLNDSHTFFIPPQRAAHINYGWRIQMIGDRCYLVAVKPGSDAEAKGLKPGDVLYVIDGYQPTPENFWLLEYLYNVLQPRSAVRVVVQSPGEKPRQVDFNASIRQGKKLLDLTSGNGFDLYDLIREEQEEGHLNAHRFYEAGNELLIWKMPQFDLSKSQVDDMMNKARKCKTLIIDLRGNGGGYEETLLRLIGNLFDHDVKVGDMKRRKEAKPLIAKTRGNNIFQGQLILLVDTGSASASELLARVVQIEKRGTIVGDHTAGAVMRAKGYSYQIGVNTIVPYGASITDADIVMTDGRSLEHIGVTPDKVLLPSGADMLAQSDPVLAYAAALSGVKLEPKKAGTLFPVKWKLNP